MLLTHTSDYTRFFLLHSCENSLHIFLEFNRVFSSLCVFDAVGFSLLNFSFTLPQVSIVTMAYEENFYLIDFPKSLYLSFIDKKRFS